MPGISPEISNLQQIPYDAIPDWCEAHFQGNMIYIPDVMALPKGNLKDILASQQIKSLISLPMMDGSNCIGFVGFDSVRNLRQYHEAEISLLKLFSNMLVNLQLRTAQENRNQELREELEKALAHETELNLMKSRFITMTSHQFRTPLTSIQASAELIGFGISTQEFLTKAKVEKNIKRIIQEVDRLTLLMNDVRFLGRVESNRIPFEPSPNDLEALLHQIIHTQETLANDDRLIKLSIEGKPQPVNVDPVLFQQLVSNLISNALKFSPQQPTPEIQLMYFPEHIELVFSDKGIGIPEKELPSLFQSFFRASNAENFNGTGLGLSIVRHITDLHQGKISVVSKVGEGSSFRLTLGYGRGLSARQG